LLLFLKILNKKCNLRMRIFPILKCNTETLAISRFSPASLEALIQWRPAIIAPFCTMHPFFLFFFFLVVNSAILGGKLHNFYGLLESIYLRKGMQITVK